ncbi:heme-degrading monooxygenase HmoA [Kroppenstedtia guangzhouensis]|uniref:Heme-degrading monooxygenase HmoA n=1 Tax=Kroppenstedtia guangzhouensis TaxID=1274356 RepID=A0ABQ1FWJ7_9BACL|nr:antibiotic biosynthesis monooxygenase [Kroppenstedtia guangzhouensis]GGA32350.1 heme-degrading monooxygenase HmoA [Kroppenstedtia guangzhouensis]
MFIMLRKMVVTEGHADQVVKKFSKEGPIEQQEGFIDLTVMKQKARQGEEAIVVMIRWESEDHWKQWEKSDTHLAGHRANRGQPKPDFLISTEVNTYEVQAVKKRR